MNQEDKERQEGLKLSYQVGALKAFMKYGIPHLSSVNLRPEDLNSYIAAIEVAINQIEKEAEDYAKK